MPLLVYDSVGAVRWSGALPESAFQQGVVDGQGSAGSHPSGVPLSRHSRLTAFAHMFAGAPSISSRLV